VTQTILEQIDTLSRIASEFSHFARMPERKFEECNIHEVLSEAKNLFSQSHDLTITTNFIESTPIVVADREELRRMFINILRNAVQALEGKGMISIQTLFEKQMIVVSFTDNGPGIPSELLSKIYEPNFSTKTDGTGLGLAIVKRIVDDIGGTIAIDSDLKTGTSVKVWLPLKQSIGNA
jgi:nitrogen fixation/metabolism regulation signal transduction histidine kinase